MFSFQVATPAPYAPIGWMSIRGYILMSRLMFMFRLLCMDTDNVYKRLLIFRLDEILENGQSRQVRRARTDAREA